MGIGDAIQRSSREIVQQKRAASTSEGGAEEIWARRDIMSILREYTPALAEYGH